VTFPKTAGGTEQLPNIKLIESGSGGGGLESIDW